MNNNLQHNADNRLLEDNKQVQQKVNKYAKKGRLRRVIAVLSAFVLLFTLNQLTFEADTLQRRETCGVEEHRHKKACKDDDGEIVCGQEEHVHTDACYQQRPVDPEPTVFDEFAEIDSQVVLASPMGEEDVSISSETVDGTVSETTMELGDDTDASVEGDASENSLEAEYDLDQLYEEEGSEAAQTEDAGVSEEGEKEYAVDGETLVFLSDVLKGTGIAASDITAVSEIQDDSFVEDHLVIEPVEGVKDEFVLKTVKSYDRIQLGIVTDDAIETAWLTGGVAVEAADDARIDGEQEQEASADEAGDEVAADVTEDEQLSEENTTVTDQILNSNENAIDETELKQTEVGNEETEVGDQAEAAEDEAAAVEDEQAEDASDTEDGQDDGEAARQDDISRRVRLDFSDYVATDTHTVYLFDEAMNAVLVSAAEIAEADGVVVAVEAAEEEEADGEAATDEDAGDGDAQADAPTDAPAAEVVGETIPVLIITGDGEYTLNGTVYTVAGLVLPGDAAADIPDVEEPSDETVPEEDADETAEEAVAARIESVLAGYRLTYDLAEAEDYPLSLRALMDMAEPVYEAQEAVADDETSGADDEGEEEAVEAAADADEVAEGEEGTVEAAADVEEEAAESEGVEYDEALLAVEATGEDWLITPVADFDATILHIGNITITLFNGRVEETYPAQTFDGATDYLTVHVEAPEGAFPAGTTMHLEDVVDEATLDKLGEPVNAGFTEVQRVHAVDITFRNRAGDEIEPLLPISVVMGVRETAEDEQTTVVHMDSEGNAEVVEAASVTDATAAPLTEDAAQAEEEQGEQEETAAEATVSFTADAFSIYAVVVSKTLETKYLVSPGESYKITLTYTEDAQIPDGAVLAVRELAGKEEQEYLEKTEESLAGNKMITSAHFFDIKIMDREGEGASEVQPAAAVEVKIERINDAAEAADAEGEAEAGADAAGEAEQQTEGEAGEQAEEEAEENPEEPDDHLIMEGDPVVGAVHFSDEDSDPEAVTATETEEAVVFAASSFSVYGLIYTVDFYYGNYVWHIDGGDHILLSDLLKVLHIDADAAKAAEVVFTDPTLVAVKHIEKDTLLSQIKAEMGVEEDASEDLDANDVTEGEEEEPEETVSQDEVLCAVDWLLVSLQPFQSHEALTVTMEDGTIYEIRVEDDYYVTFVINKEDGRQYYGHYGLSENGFGKTEQSSRVYNGADLVGFRFKNNVANVMLIPCSNCQYVACVRKSDKQVAGTKYSNPVTWVGDSNSGYEGQTYVTFFAPNGVNLVRLNNPVNGGFTVQGVGPYSCEGIYYYYSDQNATITITPNSGYKFKGWYNNYNPSNPGTPVSTNPVFSVSEATADWNLTPVCEPIVYRTINYYTSLSGSTLHVDDVDYSNSNASQPVYSDFVSEFNNQGKQISAYSFGSRYFVGWLNANKEVISDFYQFRPTDDQIYDVASYTAIYSNAQQSNNILVKSNNYAYGTVGTNDNTLLNGVIFSPVNEANNVVFIDYDSNGNSRGPIWPLPKQGYEFVGWKFNGQDIIGTTVTVNGVTHENALTAGALNQYKYNNSGYTNILEAIFSPCWKINVKPNEGNVCTFSTTEGGYFTGNVQSFTAPVLYEEGQTQVNIPYPIIPTATAEGYRFAYWLVGNNLSIVGNDKDTTRVNSDGVLTTANTITMDTTFVGMFAKGYLVRINYSELHGTGNTVELATQDNSGDPLNPRWGNTWIVGGFRTMSDPNITFVYSTDDVTLHATEKTGYTFLGWFNGNELISNAKDLHVSAITKDVNLTPVYEQKTNYYVWFDGSNGAFRGTHAYGQYTRYDSARTMYTYISSDGKVNGNVNNRFEYCQTVSIGGTTTITLPTAEDFANHTNNPLQAQPDTKYVLQGWWDIYNRHYYQPGESVTINGDSVFYADWFREDYNVGVNSNLFNTTSTRNITTRVFDYNNLFNIQSLNLDTTRSYIGQKGNYDCWTENTSSPVDFLFMFSGATDGTTINPFGRTDRNSSRESSTNGNYYTGAVHSGLFDSVKTDLFGDYNSFHLGRKYVGEGDNLYTYDPQTGYYYYDSDLHAASYNADENRFYVYKYTNRTNKSVGGDNADFLPFNYGNTEFNETNGQVNYWFGMSSEIRFFLPNDVDGKVNSAEGNQVNFSDHDMEMVYKFAGDDDVWVVVDGKVLLDLGGIHGKVYGEINFSRGTVTIAQGGIRLTRDNNYLGTETENKGIITYDGTETDPHPKNTDVQPDVTTTTFSLGEGDHTLTLYYLERGSSQSNCAIYFNIAPRYSLRIRKTLKNDDTTSKAATFSIFTDLDCTRPAVLKDYYNTSNVTNRFTTGGDTGVKHLTDLAAGRTYYIKESVSPPGYPDMSQYVIKLELDPHGKAMITPPADAPGMIDVDGLTEVPDRPGTYYLNKYEGFVDMYLLTVSNENKTSVTTKKLWSLLDNNEYITFDGTNIVSNSDAYAKVHLMRYIVASDGTPVGNHKVRLVTQYFVNNGKPTNNDKYPCVQYRTNNYEVGDCGSLSFALSTGSAGIYSVEVSSGDPVVATGVSGASGPFRINLASETRPNSGTYTVSNIQSDVVVYITIIGSADSESALMAQVSRQEPAITPGTPRTIKVDEDFRSNPKDMNGNQLQVQGEEPGVAKLYSGNNWKYEWDNLKASDLQGHPYYYYVVEDSSSAPLYGDVAFIQTTSSNGLSSGTIHVKNTMQAVKVKLRKRDSRKLNGKNVPIEGGEFYIYTEENYNSNGGPMTPEPNLISSGEMGTADGAKLQADSLGRFYTGFLPAGTYYIVEQTAPEGYQQAQTPVKTIKIVVSESGVAWCDMQDGGGSMNALIADGDNIYNLYLDNPVDYGSIQIQKNWEAESDNGATAVLLSLGVVVKSAETKNGETVTTTYAVNNDLVSDVYAHPENYLPTGWQNIAEIVTVEGERYIKLRKQGNAWPALRVDNLPLKQLVEVTVTTIADGTEKEEIRKQAVDGWYYIEEYGYYDRSNVLHKVADRADDWTVSYGSTYTDDGHSVAVGGQAYEVIKAKKTDPDTLTVTNGFVTGLTVTKTWENFTIPEGYKVRVTYVLHRGTETEDTAFTRTKVVVYQRGTDRTPVANPASWTDLAKYSPTGAVYQYWATEQKAELIPANSENDVASTDSAVVDIKECFTVAGVDADASQQNAGKFEQVITNTLPKVEKTANKLWRTSATSADTPLTPLDGTVIVLRLKQYKQGSTTPEATTIPQVTLNGIVDVDENPGTDEELINTAGNTTTAKEGTAWIANWTGLEKYYWVPTGTDSETGDTVPAHYEEYRYAAEEVSVKWGTNGSAQNVVGDMTADGQFYVTYSGTQITNTLNRKPVSFGKKWVNLSQQGQRWVQNGSNNVPIYVTLTRTRPLATGETPLVEGATQIVETLLSGQEMVYDTTNSVTIAEMNHAVRWTDNSTDNRLEDNEYVYRFTIDDLEKYAYAKEQAIEWTYTLTEDRIGSVPGRLFRTSYEISGKDHADEGEYIVNIEENTFELPSTGGHGTGMFYILGSILTVLAAVLLIAKKRSDAAGIE